MRWADASGGITGHYSLDPVNRGRCPGPYPFDELFAFLNQSAQPQGDDMLQITDPFAKAFFTEVNGEWHCKNGGKVIHGLILDFYRKIQGAVRLPQTDEMHTIPDVVWQLFESGVIVYDPKHKLDNPGGECYMVKLESDLVKNILFKPYIDAANTASKQAADSQLQAKSLQTKVDSLTAQLKQAQGPDQNQLKSLLQALQNSEKAIQSFVK
jgi:hypothetical protein